VESVDAAPLLFTNLSAYAQDTWRAASRLTLTYGLRWEVNPPPTAREGKQLYAVVGLDNPTTMTVAPGAIYKTQYVNFAPRVGAAFALSRRAELESALRGGWGVFYDTGNSTAGNVAANFPNNSRRNFTNQPYPLPQAVSAPPVITGALPISPFGFRAFDPELKLPRVYQWNLSFEQSLGAGQTITAGYVAAVGRRLLRLELLQAATLNPNFLGNVTVTRGTATSDYHALQLQFQRRLSRGLQALASYTWSHAIDVVSNDASSLVRSDRLDPNLDRGDADFDVRHAVSAAVTYNFPKADLGAFADVLLNGWALDSIFLARSATPVNVLTGVANLFGIQPRPNIVPGVPFYLDDPTLGGGQRINRAAFVAPTAGQQGNLPRNALRSFPVWQLDLAVRRQFNLSDRSNLQFRAEMFNVLNHPNFGDPVRTLSSGLFGQADRMLGRTLSPGGGAGFNPLYQIGGPRSIQLALRLQF